MKTQPNGKPVRWWMEKEASLRKDVYDALVELRAYVENQGHQPVIRLAGMSTYRERQLTQVYTTRVAEWEFGYKVVPIDYAQGFFRRTLFVKLHGGKLTELNKRERSQIIDAISKAALDEGSDVQFEPISDTTMALHQDFAVLFWHEGNRNLVTPSADLILGKFPILNKKDSADD